MQGDGDGPDRQEEQEAGMGVYRGHEVAETEGEAGQDVDPRHDEMQADAPILPRLWDIGLARDGDDDLGILVEARGSEQLLT
jgi:hypothetical protein